MNRFGIVPTVEEYSDFMSFAKQHEIDCDDLIITNKYILDVEKMGLTCSVIYQEEYGSGEPTDVMVNLLLKDLENVSYKRLIAIGGGTVIDIAKIIAVAPKGTKDVNVLYENMNDLKKQCEFFIIPTTCGTGSEMTNISIVNRTTIGTKQGLVSQEMYCDHAVLVAKFIESLPYGVFATSSLDALVHGVESFLSPNATALSELFSKEAIRLILEGYQKLVTKKCELSELAVTFLRASNYAGIAFGNAGCGTVHAMSYAFGGKYHVAHGESNYELFTAVLQYYQAQKPDGKMKDLIHLFQQVLNAEKGLKALEDLLNQILPWKPMADYGMTKEDVLDFAKSTIQNQTRLLNNSYVPMTEEAIGYIYLNCLT